MNQPSLPVIDPAVNPGWFQNVPTWYKFKCDVSATGVLTVTFPDGTQASTTLPAGLTQDITLVSMDTNAFVHAVRVKSRVIAAGVTTLTAKIGVAGTDTLYLSAAFDLKAAVADTNFAPLTTTGNTVGNNTVAAIALVVLLTSTVDNLAALASGAFDVWVLLSKLP